MGDPFWGQRPNPCKGCPDRYTACSDHCRKEAFLKWKAEQDTIRENRRKFNETTGYTVDAIRKSRKKQKHSYREEPDKY